jgi:hypothetical protein
MAWASLKGLIRKDFQDIDPVTSLFREALQAVQTKHRKKIKQ